MGAHAGNFIVRSGGRSARLLAGALLLAAIGVLALAAGSARAATCDTSWNGGNGDWSNGADWSAGVPSNSDNACINASGTYTVTISGESVGVGSLQLGVGAASGTQTLEIRGTNGGSGELDINDSGGTVGSSGDLQFTVACASAGCSAADLFNASSSPLVNQGTIESDQGSDSGASPRELISSVTNGGSVELNAPLQNLGTSTHFDNNAGGTITNNGGSASLFVGAQGKFVQAGGTTSPATPNPAHPAVVIDDTTNSSIPVLSYTGTGASTIAARDQVKLTGGLGSAQNLVIESPPSCSGQTRVTSPSGFTNAGTITLTGACDSGLFLTAGTLTNTGTLTMAATGADVTRELKGSLTNSGTLNIDGATVFDGNGASLTQTGGTTVIPNQTLDMGGSAGAFHLQGGTLQAGSNAVISSGSLSNTGGSVLLGSGSTAGHLTLDGGSYSQDSAGQLMAIIAGTNAGKTYSQLTVTGASTLGGKLTVNTVVAPVSGHLYTVVGGGSVNGKFASIAGLLVPNATSPTAGYQPQYSSTALSLLAEAVFPLQVKKAGPGKSTGTVTSSPTGIDCGSTCRKFFFQTQSVTLTAHPGSGWVFNGWTGGCVGSGTTCKLRTNEARTVTATFSHGTTTKLTSSKNPVKKGRKVTFTAAVSPHPDGGTVDFTIGGKAISGCRAVPVNTATGKATCSVTTRATGSHKVRATYSGDAGFAHSTSSTLTQRVTK